MSGPLRKVVPIGWIGGRYTTSKPIAAMAGSRSAAVRNVPDTGGSPSRTTAPSERGKNSYQEAARRPSGGRSSSRSASTAARSVRRPVPSGTPSAARSYSSAPSSSITSVSRPAGILTSAARRQPVTGSAHASTAYVQRPSSSGVTCAPQRSLPGASSRMGVQGPVRPSGPSSTTLAPTGSCPSPKSVAVTWKVSPGTAFTGRRPQSITGRTSQTGTPRGAGPACADEVTGAAWPGCGARVIALSSAGLWRAGRGRRPRRTAGRTPDACC